MHTQGDEILMYNTQDYIDFLLLLRKPVGQGSEKPISTFLSWKGRSEHNGQTKGKTRQDFITITR